MAYREQDVAPRFHNFPFSLAFSHEGQISIMGYSRSAHMAHAREGEGDHRRLRLVIHEHSNADPGFLRAVLSQALTSGVEFLKQHSLSHIRIELGRQGLAVNLMSSSQFLEQHGLRLDQAMTGESGSFVAAFNLAPIGSRRVTGPLRAKPG